MSKTITHRGKARRSNKKRELKTSTSDYHYCNYNPIGVNPNTTQFEPTESSPISRRAKQAGMQ